jgi:hypothetical protein
MSLLEPSVYQAFPGMGPNPSCTCEITDTGAATWEVCPTLSAAWESIHCWKEHCIIVNSMPLLQRKDLCCGGLRLVKQVIYLLFYRSVLTMTSKVLVKDSTCSRASYTVRKLMIKEGVSSFITFPELWRYPEGTFVIVVLAKESNSCHLLHWWHLVSWHAWLRSAQCLCMGYPHIMRDGECLYHVPTQPDN